ncbi:uncharacterized protein LOC114272175 [Camellia sinensis]|uniref:uncharacterized protein LOC114272175 n=1 Tax=Camellia sinensis TaxID=4442 RepID=UPI0010366919|nr:uncharacterized protein LOC114272175 [Camellia sinensis]
MVVGDDKLMGGEVVEKEQMKADKGWAVVKGNGNKVAVFESEAIVDGDDNGGDFAGESAVDSVIGLGVGGEVDESAAVEEDDDMESLVGIGGDEKVELEVTQIGNLRCVLLCFEAVSGLRVNLSNSELIHVGEVPRLPVLAAVLGCKVVRLPVSYLGLPLGASFKETRVWAGVVDKVQRCLAGWKRQYLSKGGRITLIKSVLPSILMYFMSVHVILVGVAKRLEKLQHDFLWSGGAEGFHYHLVAWERVCTLKERRGFWVCGNWWCLIKASLGKWLWCFVEEQERLWRNMRGYGGAGDRVRFKYGEEGGCGG